MSTALENLALKQSAEKIRNWVIGKALPLWADRAQHKSGRWVEHLNLDGTPDLSADLRWRVLARQIYVYAEATRWNWFDGKEIARQTYEHMRERGYVQRVRADGTVTERRRDLYDHAFFLLASISLYRLTKEPQYLAAVEDICSTLDTEFKHPDGGWRETPRGALPRRQNPHMHLLEAFLYLYNETRDPNHLAYAEHIIGLFKAHFFDSKHHIIREFFNEDWSYYSGEQGTTAEPGHAMEWIWLLYRYEFSSGRDTKLWRQALYANALKQRGYFLNDEEDIKGNIRRETRRLWVQTEVIKAHLTMAENNVSGSADMAAAFIDGLFETYLKTDGTWCDQTNACGGQIAKTIPVSTFYHIACMAFEAERVSGLGRLDPL
ncbi:AGE family epimerase/isomerase [Hellea balneolensis]|uniref:AGE family epimerase/isomerase n=1 Tax=Hellea balneolensis TaxID=287478 RepID=UPI00040D257D|nr:AGE family epimerase/isomerase [Hellea balneolensis]